MTKKKKTTRKRREDGSGVFARVAPARASNLPDGMSSALAWRGFRHPRSRGLSANLGSVPISTHERARERVAENLLRQLESLGLDPEVAAEIASIGPDGSYAMILTVKGYNGSTRSKDVTYAGRGRALWERIAFFAGSDEVEIVHAEFIELLDFADDYQGSYALWKRDAVVRADGKRFDGIGDYVRWRNARDKRVGGRPKQRRGRHTYAEGKKIAESQRKAEMRAKISKAKISGLLKAAKKLDPTGKGHGLAAGLRRQARTMQKRAKRGKGKR